MAKRSTEQDASTSAPHDSTTTSWKPSIFGQNDSK
uniref:Uncharacterized protein n=1 Tax=Arundo donax TaxID=35708 RepID=A0A0A9BBB7_ARUDO